MSDYRIDFDSLEWSSPMAGVRHKIIRQAGRALRLVEYDRSMAPHWCEKGHAGCILDGRFEIEFTNETVVFVAGDGVLIPTGPAHRHRARALSDVVRALFIEAP